MKKLAMVLAGVAMVVGLSACDSYFASPEKKAFDEFLAQCKADPSTPDCVAYNTKPHK